MRQVFKDNVLEARFQKEGFVVVPLLEARQIEALKNFYVANAPKPSSGFHSTHFYQDKAYKYKVHQEISETCSAAVNLLLNAYESVFANFMVKEIGPNSIMPLHADWTYVDEEQFQSVAIWCPLVDTTALNGRLGVVPKSHLLQKNYRGPKIPSPFHDHNQHIIDNYGKLLDLKAGEAVIYNHQLLHFSPPNLSSERRVAFNLVLTPKEAPIVHYASLDSYPKTYKYKDLTSSFFIDYTHFENPNEAKLEMTFSKEVEAFSEGYINKTLGDMNWIDKLKSFFA